MLTPYKEHFKKAGEFVARIFLRLGFTPNRVTLLSLGLGLAACVFFVWNRNPVLFGFLIIFFGLLDFVDGTLARLSGRVTKFGSYLDAMCDRIFESAVALAAAFVSGYWALLFLLAVGAILISYAKARAGMEVSVSNTEWPDFMERTERGFIFAFGIILWGIFPQEFFGHNLFFWTLVILNLLVYFTLIQRFLRARRLIQLRS